MNHKLSVMGYETFKYNKWYWIRSDDEFLEPEYCLLLPSTFMERKYDATATKLCAVCQQVWLTENAWTTMQWKLI